MEGNAAYSVCAACSRHNSGLLIMPFDCDPNDHGWSTNVQSFENRYF